MGSTGIVRRIDDLGRVAIPKEVRRTLRIREGDPLEVFVQDGGVFLKKYSPLHELDDFAQKYADSLYRTTGNISVITDRDTIIAIAGISKNDFLQKCISSKLERIIDDKIKFFTNTETINIVEEQTVNFHSMVIVPILSDGDAIGSVILAETKTNVDFGEVECKLAENAAKFLGMQMES